MLKWFERITIIAKRKREEFKLTIPFLRERKK
jgi:hypothetical protein